MLYINNILYLYNMEVSIEDDYITFRIKNDVSENNLTQFYTPEYFKFIGNEPEIFISGNNKTINNSGIVGGFFQDEQLLTIPYKYFVYLVEKNPIYTRIKTIKSNEIPNEKSNETPKEIPNETPKEIPNEIPKGVTPKESINLDSIRSLFQNTQSKQIEQQQQQSIEQPSIEQQQQQSIEQPSIEPTNEIILKFIKTENTIDNGKNLGEIISSGDPIGIDVNKNGLTYQEVYNIKRVENYISSKKKEIYQEDVFYLNGKWIIINSNIIGKTLMNLDTSLIENTELTKKYN